MRLILAVLGMVLIAGSASAAETHKIVLDEGKSSTYEIDAHVGDTIEIIHNDETGAKHDLYATDEAHSFDLTGMAHGDHFDFKVVEPGAFTIHCHAMDHMKIMVNVSE